VTGTPTPWARHFQHVWEERSASRSLPDWLRVACLAYGKHRANGHANFRPGEVALVLARLDETTGVVTALARQGVHRAIKVAVGNGWLGAGSTARCLIVPAHAITGGLGRAEDACPQHAPATSKARRPRTRLKSVSGL